MNFLIIDDNIEMLEVTKFYIEKCFKDSYVDAINNGKQALLLDKKFDLIFMDWTMPGISGLNLLKELRKKFSTKIIIITGLSEDDINNDGEEDILVKPYKYVQFAELIKKNLNFL